jgi:hypothetical protein
MRQEALIGAIFLGLCTAAPGWAAEDAKETCVAQAPATPTPRASSAGTE